MGVYIKPGSKMWHVWIDGARKPRVNTKIPIGTTKLQKTESRKLADQVYHRLMLERASDRFGIARDKPARTFADHRAWYAEHVSVLKRSKVSEVSMLGQLGEFFDGYLLSAIDHALVREWRSVRAKTSKGSTIRRHEALLRHVLTTAVPEYLDQHPLIGLPSVRVEPTDTRVLSRDEERRLLAALQTPADTALVIGALDTLLRMSNMCHLSRAQDHGSYLFSDTKVGAVKVPISRRLRTALDALSGTGHYYFPQYAGTNTHAARMMFESACRRANIALGRKTGGLSFHCLRHTGATRMLEAGVNIKTVMKLGGWQNTRILERYLHPADELAVAAVEAIGSG